MTSRKARTYLGFGFGAIQAGLFLFEASASQAFDRLVVAEVVPEVVDAVRQADGYYTCNIAHANRLEATKIGPIQIENPGVPQDRIRLVEVIAEASEIGTAIPSIDYYVSAEPGSVHRVLAAGLREKAKQQGPRAVIYTAENHNHAAEILQENVMTEIALNEQAEVLARVQFLNTVIGKMSGSVIGPEQIQNQNVIPVTPGAPHAFLVEAFNRILISKIQFAAPFQRGLNMFEEKTDLLPFEEAKLYGHNAVHALAAYLGALRGVRYIADLQAYPEIVAFLKTAFINEAGAALVQKYDGLDPIFTEAGFRHYATDLLERMMSPHLRDTVQRVSRDPERKLGWNDRLVGTMRLVLQQGIKPVRFALGAAAAVNMLDKNILKDEETLNITLSKLWADASPDPSEKEVILSFIIKAGDLLQRWQNAGFSNLVGLGKR